MKKIVLFLLLAMLVCQGCAGFSYSDRNRSISVAAPYPVGHVAVGGYARPYLGPGPIAPSYFGLTPAPGGGYYYYGK